MGIAADAGRSQMLAKPISGSCGVLLARKARNCIFDRGPIGHEWAPTQAENSLIQLAWIAIGPSIPSSRRVSKVPNLSCHGIAELWRKLNNPLDVVGLFLTFFGRLAQTQQDYLQTP